MIQTYGLAAHSCQLTAVRILGAAGFVIFAAGTLSQA